MPIKIVEKRDYLNLIIPAVKLQNSAYYISSKKYLFLLLLRTHKPEDFMYTGNKKMLNFMHKYFLKDIKQYK